MLEADLVDQLLGEVVVDGEVLQADVRSVLHVARVGLREDQPESLAE